jgi:hypothetical protein
LQLSLRIESGLGYALALPVNTCKSGLKVLPTKKHSSLFVTKEKRFLTTSGGINERRRRQERRQNVAKSNNVKTCFRDLSVNDKFQRLFVNLRALAE